MRGARPGSCLPTKNAFHSARIVAQLNEYSPLLARPRASIDRLSSERVNNVPSALGREFVCRHWVTRPVLALLMLSVCFAFARTAVAATYSEDAVKAAFLHRFAAYVQWPADAPQDAPFVIAVEGADNVAAQLEQLLPGLSIQNRRAQLRKVEAPADLDGVNILYVGSGRGPQSQALIRAAASRPILLVTDADDGLVRGAIINFVRVDRTVRFEVSLTAAERSGLKINSGLLSVAARVEGRPQAGIGCPDLGASAIPRPCRHFLLAQDDSRTKLPGVGPTHL